jgi:hypothetical protein
MHPGELLKHDEKVHYDDMPSFRLLLTPRVLQYPSTMLAYTETIQIPRVPDPMDRQVKDLGTPNGTMNRHLNLALILII